MYSRIKFAVLNIGLLFFLYSTIGYYIQFLEQPVYVSTYKQFTTGNLWIMFPFLTVSLLILIYDFYLLSKYLKNKQKNYTY